MAAAGAGERLGTGVPKALSLLAGEPLLVHAVRGVRAALGTVPVVVAAPPGGLAAASALLASYDVVVVEGGASRQESVRRAVAVLPAGVRLVLVHDAARALTPADVFARVVAALGAGAVAVVPVVEVVDTLKRVDAGGGVARTVDRALLRAVQTPQGFVREVLEQVHAGAGGDATDDAGLVERQGLAVACVPGSAEAFKVTRPLDLLLAEAVLGAR